MTEKTDKPGVFQAICPCCQATLWIDSGTQSVIKSEKGKRAKGSLDELVVKEKARQEQFDRKFDASFELQREKHSKADEMFKQALEKAEKGGDEEDKEK